MTYDNKKTEPHAPGYSVADLIRSGRLAWRLLLDPRVATLAKFAVPALALAYVVSPVDLIPDFVPVLGQLDDLAIVALAIRLFIQLAPPAVVAEHRSDLGEPPDRAAGEPGAAGDVVDADYRVIH